MAERPYNHLIQALNCLAGNRPFGDYLCSVSCRYSKLDACDSAIARDVLSIWSCAIKQQPEVIVRCINCEYWGQPFDSYEGHPVAHCSQFPDTEAFRDVFFCQHGKMRGEHID